MTLLYVVIIFLVEMYVGIIPHPKTTFLFLFMSKYKFCANFPFSDVI